MIPKVIHYFWEGGKKPKLVEKCIASWPRVMPGWEIREWNLARLKEEGIDVGCQFMADVVALRLWGFAIDVVRWAVLYREGGVFLDADVELIRPLDALCGADWVSAECDDPVKVNPGQGLAISKGSSFALAHLEEYARMRFDPRDRLACASPNVTARLLGRPDAPRILPARVMNPIGWSGGRLATPGADCCAIHWYAASWFTWRQRLAYVTLPRLGIDVGAWIKRWRAKAPAKSRQLTRQ